MTAVEADRSAADARDADDLARLGYAQQLRRRLGAFSNFALSFSIISILTGAVILYGWGLQWGGPAGMVGGWIVVSLLTLCVAASLAVLASAYPTAGALYHWSAILGGNGCGFATAWLNVIGQFAITAGIDYGLSEFLAPMLGLASTQRTLLGLTAALLFSQGLLNHVGIGVVNLLSWVSAWYHMAGVLLLCGALALFAPHQPVRFLATTVRGPGHGLAYSLLLGVLQAQWTFTGYDASAHVTEETHDPRRTAPKGILLSVGVSAVFGLLLLVTVTLAIPDLAAALAPGRNAFLYVVRSGLPGWLGAACMWMVLGAMWFCGLGSVTSNSRMIFAFARDGGLGQGRALARVSARHRTPHLAIWLSCAMALVVTVWGGTNSVIVSMSTIALYASYGLPVALALGAARRGRLERGPFALGRAFAPIAAVAVAWVAVLAVLFVLPPNDRVGYTFVGCLVALDLYWTLWAEARFVGPQLARVGAPPPS